MAVARLPVVMFNVYTHMGDRFHEKNRNSGLLPTLFLFYFIKSGMWKRAGTHVRSLCISALLPSGRFFRGVGPVNVRSGRPRLSAQYVTIAMRYFLPTCAQLRVRLFVDLHLYLPTHARGNRVNKFDQVGGKQGHVRSNASLHSLVPVRTMDS